MTKINQKQKIILTSILLLTTFICCLNQTMMLTSLPVISCDMHVGLNVSQWVNSGYFLIIGVVTPLTAGLYKRFSNRKLIISSLLILLIGTILGCISKTFIFLLFSRVLQATCHAILFSFLMTTMVSIYSLKKRGIVLGMTSMVISLGSAFGPTIGGLIINYFNWHCLFYLTLPFVFLLLIITIFIFPNYSSVENIHLDIKSMVLSLLGLGLFLSGITMLSTNIYFSLIIIIVGIILIAYFIYIQDNMQKPLLQISILKQKNFRIFTIIGLLTFMLRTGYQQMIPIFAENILSLNTLISGLLILPGSIIYSLCAPLGGKIYDKHGNKIIIYGILIMILSNICLLFVNHKTNVYYLCFIFCLMMFGYAGVYSPALSSAYKKISMSQNSEGVALNTTLRQTSGSIANTIMVILFDWNNSLICGFKNSVIFTLIVLMLASISFYASKYKK